LKDAGERLRDEKRITAVLTDICHCGLSTILPGL
jgi:hypothetical protein